MTAAALAGTIAGHAAVAMVLRHVWPVDVTEVRYLERTVLVVGRDPELSEALRDRLDRTRVTVVEAHPSRAAEAVRRCRPWPWMVVVETVGVEESLTAALSGVPVLVMELGPVGPRLPTARAYSRFSELVAGIEAAIHSCVFGMRLAVGSGVELPGGGHLVSPELEALVAAHPRPVRLAAARLRRLNAQLTAHGVHTTVRAVGGDAVLTEVDG